MSSFIISSAPISCIKDNNIKIWAFELKVINIQKEDILNIKRFKVCTNKKQQKYIDRWEYFLIEVKSNIGKELKYMKNYAKAEIYKKGGTLIKTNYEEWIEAPPF